METDPEIIAANLETADKGLTKEKGVPDLPREKIVGSMRTYASDIAEMMKREKGSIIKIALAEQQRRTQYEKKTDPTTTKNIVVMIIGFALIAGGIMIFISSILGRGKPVEVIQNSNTLPSFMFTENQVQIDVTNMNRAELLEAINSKVSDTELAPGAINNLFISYKSPSGVVQMPATAFLQKLGVNMPEDFWSGVWPNFMAGVFGKEGGNELFLIFRVKDFNDTFLAMRQWEASMLSEFVRTFGIDTSAYGNVIFNKDFETAILLNKEARLLKDSDGKILLSYIFLDKNTVMITTEGVSVEEITKRMNLQTIK